MSDVLYNIIYEWVQHDSQISTYLTKGYLSRCLILYSTYSAERTERPKVGKS